MARKGIAADPADGPSSAPGAADARTRILESAYELFARHGIRAVGVDRIIAESGVAKMTLYHHFRSKDELVLACLDLRELRWTREWLQAEVERRTSDARERLLGVFDALAEWFHRPDYEGCLFVNTLLEIGDEGDPIHRAAIAHIAVIEALLRSYAEQAELANPALVARQSQLLVMGAIVSACRGDVDAGLEARALAELLVAGSE